MVTDSIIKDTDLILLTGSNGFIGSKTVEILLRCGYKNLRCLVRSSSNLEALNKIIDTFDEANIEVLEGNLLSHDDCDKATKDVSIIYHLAAGRGEKSYANAYLNSVVTTRNLLDSALKNSSLRRFLCVSSFTVYSNSKMKHGSCLNEEGEIETHPHLRGEAYCYAKVRQDEMVQEYGKEQELPYVIVRPGVVYGPGNRGITGRVGVSPFGVFLHLGGSNRIPFTYVDNCAYGIVLAGLKKGVDGEIFNIIDDDLPTSREFLWVYKKQVRDFKSIYLPHPLSYLLCFFWEKYSKWSENQLPPVFNRNKWYANWKSIKYSNEKIKKMLGWKQEVPNTEAFKQYFEYEKKRYIDD
jgi:nucleoside-diphosphate-sugar epimerase